MIELCPAWSKVALWGCAPRGEKEPGDFSGDALGEGLRESQAESPPCAHPQPQSSQVLSDPDTAPRGERRFSTAGDRRFLTLQTKPARKKSA